MKSIFERVDAGTQSAQDARDNRIEASPIEIPRDACALGPAIGRIATYDALSAPPRVEDVSATTAADFIEAVSSRTYEIARQQGGNIPYVVIREVVENLIHARFREVVVTILDDGMKIRFSDNGPGIADKERSFHPGFTTATQEMKSVIKGVGSGLPLVKECLSFAGGAVTIEDNLGSGTVVTLEIERQPIAEEPPTAKADDRPPVHDPALLSRRQKRVLSLAMELGAVGPSAVAGELGIALSTAYRDLAFLEEVGLLASRAGGKRELTDDGVACLDALFMS